MKAAVGFFIVVCIAMVVFGIALFFPFPAQANWRWAPPEFKPVKVVYKCADFKCIKKSYLKARKRHQLRIDNYNDKRLAEWKYWISQPIADCTWVGESSPPGDYSGQFAPWRYTVPNGAGSDAYGKYQMMPGTYSSYAKYGNWSPLDQEIAGHRLYADQGTGPWQACG